MNFIRSIDVIDQNLALHDENRVSKAQLLSTSPALIVSSKFFGSLEALYFTDLIQQGEKMKI